MQVRCAGAHWGVQPGRGGNLSPEHSRCRHSGEYLPLSLVISRVKELETKVREVFTITWEMFYLLERLLCYKWRYVIKKYCIFLHHIHVNLSANFLSPLQWDSVASFVLPEVFSAVANQNYQKCCCQIYSCCCCLVHCNCCCYYNSGHI